VRPVRGPGSTESGPQSPPSHAGPPLSPIPSSSSQRLNSPSGSSTPSSSAARRHLLLCYDGPVKTCRLPAVIDSDSDGFFAYCPDLQGCYTQGRTFEEAIANIRDAVRLHLEDRRSTGEPIGSVG